MSEIRVNTIVAAEGTSAPNLPYGVQVPTGMGITGAGGINISGVCTAGIGTFTNIFGTLNGNSQGLTGTPNISCGTIAGSTGTFSGAVNVDATTDSTSATSGALIVDGGLGVAKNVYIGAGLSVAGTLTYEDVTNVDSVGLITAKSGVNVTGGQLQVGVAYSVGAAGVCTAAGFVGSLTGAASQITVADESSDTSCNVVYTTAATGDLAPKTGTNLTFNSSSGALTATSFVGALTGTASDATAAAAGFTVSGGALQSTSTSGCQITGGEFKVGTAVTISSTAGVATFSSDVYFANPADGAKFAYWNPSNDRLNFQDSAQITFGTGSDLKIYHNGSHSFIDEAGTGNLYIRAGTDNGITLNSDADVILYHDNAIKFQTTNDGVSITGMTTTSAGMTFNGMLKEEVNIVANKLSAGVNIDVADGMVHYYSTNETATATPNIRFNSSYSLNNKMAVGQTITVTIIYKPNGAGYYAQLQIDGSNVTEYWNGGAPTSANAGGLDVLTHTITKTADAAYAVVLSNVQNYTS